MHQITEKLIKSKKSRDPNDVRIVSLIAANDENSTFYRIRDERPEEETCYTRDFELLYLAEREYASRKVNPR